MDLAGTFDLSGMALWLWLVVAVVMAIVEVLSFGLITMWFVVGALVAFVASLLGAGFIAQLALFLAVSVACLVFLRPAVVKYRPRGQAAESTCLGAVGIVTEPIDPLKLTGAVRLADGLVWTARSADGSPVPAGANVRVVGQESVKLIVEPLPGKDA